MFEDVAIGYAAYPRTLKFGGNTGKVNTFTGVNVADLTGGVFNAESLTNKNNLACFSYQILQNAIPDFLNLAISGLSPIFNLINKEVKPAFIGGISCPQLQQFDVSLFRSFVRYFPECYHIWSHVLTFTLCSRATRILRLDLIPTIRHR